MASYDDVKDFIEKVKSQKYFPNPEFCAAMNPELVGCADPNCKEENCKFRKSNVAGMDVPAMQETEALEANRLLTQEHIAGVVG